MYIYISSVLRQLHMVGYCDTLCAAFLEPPNTVYGVQSKVIYVTVGFNINRC